MINSYTYYCYARLGHLTSEPKSFHKDPELFYNTLALEYNGLEYLLDDGGLCEDTLDDSEAIFLMFNMEYLTRTTVSSYAKMIKEIAEEELEDELQIYVSGDDSMVMLKFKCLHEEIMSLYVSPYEVNSLEAYNTIRPYNQKGKSKKLTYEISTLVLHSDKVYVDLFEDTGLSVVQE